MSLMNMIYNKTLNTIFLISLSVDRKRFGENGTYVSDAGTDPNWIYGCYMQKGNQRRREEKNTTWAPFHYH